MSSRIIKMNLTIWGHKITEICWVNDDTTVDKKKDLYEQLNDEIRTIGTSREIIILGDLNEQVGKKRNNNIVGSPEIDSYRYVSRVI